MRFGVVGGDAQQVERALLAPAGARGTAVDATSGALPGNLDALVVLSGDARAPIMAAVASFAARGGPVLGVGAGFGVLCEWGLLDGAVTVTPGSERAAVHCLVEGRPTPFTQAIPAGRQLSTTLGEVAGRFEHADVAALEADARVVARYASADGEVCASADPTGSANNIAGICNGAGNIVGLVPEAPTAWIESVLAWQRGTPARV